MTDREKQVEELARQIMAAQEAGTTPEESAMFVEIVLAYSEDPRLANLREVMRRAEEAQPEAWAKFMRLWEERQFPQEQLISGGEEE